MLKYSGVNHLICYCYEKAHLKVMLSRDCNTLEQLINRRIMESSVEYLGVLLHYILLNSRHFHQIDADKTKKNWYIKFTKMLEIKCLTTPYNV